MISKFPSILLLAILISLTSCVEQGQLRSRDPDPKYLELSALPEGLSVTNSPSEVRATSGAPGNASYTWLHSTTVSTSREESLRVVEYHLFAWLGDHWFIMGDPNNPLDNEDFEDFFSCPGGMLRPGQSYTDRENRIESDELKDLRVKWIFVAENANGVRYRGEGELKLLGQLN